MAKRLRRMLRDSDMAARMGGVLATEQRFKASEAAAALSHRLESATRGRFKLDSALIDHAGASVGAVVAEPGRSSAQALLSKAEATMQAVKRSHKRDASTAPPVGRIARYSWPVIE
jgi:GGDEF domain-containing protein